MEHYYRKHPDANLMLRHWLEHYKFHTMPLSINSTADNLTISHDCTIWHIALDQKTPINSFYPKEKLPLPFSKDKQNPMSFPEG